MFGERVKVGMIEVEFDQELFALKALRTGILHQLITIQQGLASPKNVLISLVSMWQPLPLVVPVFAPLIR